MAKTISQRATRFLAVDMKDRLKSAFVRNPTDPAPESDHSRADDAPDYSAIFAHRARGAKPAPTSATRDLHQLAEPTISVTMKSPARQIAPDIEEAQIVTEPREAAASPAWESAALKTRKAETSSPARPPQGMAAIEFATPIAIESPDFTATLKGGKTASVGSRTSRSPISGATIDSGGSAKPVLNHEPVLVEGAKQELNDDLEYPPGEILAVNSKHEEPVAQKSKFRFFSDSTESVRLKVEKRPEERPADESPESNLEQQTAEPTRPESEPVEVAVQSMQPTTVSPLRETVSLRIKDSKDANPAMTEAVTVVPAPSEQPNFKLQKENDSMDAKGQETDNGTAAPADGSGAAAAIAIERNSKFSGQLKFSGAITIDGQVEGELIAERIVVHEGGVVNASVEGNIVIIAGNVKGDIFARHELEILPSGVVNGS